MYRRKSIVQVSQILVGIIILISFSSQIHGLNQDVEQPVDDEGREIIYSTSFEEDWGRNQINQYVSPSEWTIKGITSSHQDENQRLTHYWSKMDNEFSYIHDYWPYSPLSPPFVESGNYSVCIWGNDGNGEPSYQEDQSDEWLISPALDFSSYYDLSLQFWSIYVPTQQITIPFPYRVFVDNSYFIKASMDNGETWKKIADLRETRFTFGVNQFYDVYNNFDEPIILDLDSVKAKDLVRIAWHYKYPGNGTADLWIIDNVTITGRYDSIIPEVEIVKPEQNQLYVSDNHQFDIDGKTIIIGSMNVKVDPTDEGTGTSYVEFYIDDTLVHTDEEYPFSWQWRSLGFKSYSLKTIAYDHAGNANEDVIEVIKLL